MLDYTGIGEALASVISNVDSMNLTRYELEATEFTHNRTPFADIRLVDADNDVRAGQDYFTDLTLAVDIYTMDMSSIREAATLRDGLLADAQNAVRANPNFHISLESSILGGVEFTTSKDEGTGWFTARASFQVIAKAFTDRS